MGIKFADLEKASKFFAEQGMSAQEIEAKMKQLWEKNNMTEKMSKAHSDLLCFGKSEIEFEGEKITMVVALNGSDLVFGKDKE